MITKVKKMRGEKRFAFLNKTFDFPRVRKAKTSQPAEEAIVSQPQPQIDTTETKSFETPSFETPGSATGSNLEASTVKHS